MKKKWDGKISGERIANTWNQISKDIDKFDKEKGEIMKRKITYNATGIVLGNCWGGGQGGYPAEELSDKTYKGLINQIESGVENGGLDSGMGFESLIGARMIIQTTTEIMINDKPYTNFIHKTYYTKGLTQAEKYVLGTMSEQY